MLRYITRSSGNIKNILNYKNMSMTERISNYFKTVKTINHLKYHQPQYTKRRLKELVKKNYCQLYETIMDRNVNELEKSCSTQLASFIKEHIELDIRIPFVIRDDLDYVKIKGARTYVEKRRGLVGYMYFTQITFQLNFRNYRNRFGYLKRQLVVMEKKETDKKDDDWSICLIKEQQ